MALVTAKVRSSSTKMLWVPVVPEVVAAVYLPKNLSPMRAGSPTKARTSESVTAPSVAQPSKRAMSAFLLVTGGRLTSSTPSGRSR